MTDIERLVITKQIELLNKILLNYFSTNSRLISAIQGEKMTLEKLLKEDEEIRDEIRYHKG